MQNEKMTKAKVKRLIDAIPEMNKRSLPAGNVSYSYEMAYKDCNIEERWIEYKTVIKEAAINRIGMAHGGYLSGLLDEAMGLTLTIMRGIHEANGVTADIRCNFIKPLVAGDSIVIRAKVEHAGRQTAITTAEIYKGKEKCAMSIETWTMACVYPKDLDLWLKQTK